MKNKKFVLALSALGAAALGIGSSVAFSAIGGQGAEVQAATDYNVGTLAELKTFFDGAGTNCNNNITLTADIDCNGAYVSGMAGEFAGTFNGNGYKIYNASIGANKSLFNIIATAGVVKNLVLDATITGAVVRPVSYLNNGTIQNSTVILHTGATSVNNVAAYAYLAGSGTYTNLYTDWVVDHTGADWLCTIYRDQSSTNITNCYYTMGGSVHSSANFQADSATVTTDVHYINAAKTANTTINGTVVLTPETYGTTSSSVTYSSSNTNVATVTNTGLTGTVTGVAAGTADITCTVVSTLGTFTGKTTVTVVAAAPVSAVALNKTSTSVYQTKTETLTATLTGTEYTSIVWSSDAESIATVSGSGTSGLVTAVAVGSANITVTVVSTSGTFTASCAVTVNPRVTVNVTLLESKNTEAKTAYWDQAWISPYGEFTSGLVKMTKVQSNGKDLVLRRANPTHSNTVDEFKVWSYDIDITGKTMTWTNAWVQFSSGVGLWGAGFQITSAAGRTAVLGYSGSANPVDSGYAPADVKSVATYAASNVYSDTWRNSSSICYLLDGSHNANLNTLLGGYDSLTADQKTIADVINDSTTAYTSTYGETIAMLKAKSTLSDGTYTPKAAYDGGLSLFTNDDNTDKSWIVVLAGLSTIALVAGSVYFFKKKAQR